MKGKQLNIALIFIFGALGGLLFGFDTGIISGAAPLIENTFHLNTTEAGFIVSSTLIGSTVGALSIGALSDKFGRKKLFILSAILFLIGSGLCAISTGFISMVCGRIILGLAVGGASALTPAYLAELADKEHRGSLGTMFQLMITLGILLAYVSNLLFLGHNFFHILDWRWMLASSLIPALILLLGGIILPESPRYLIKKGQVTEARKVLTRLRSTTETDLNKEVESIKEVANEPKGSLKEIFTLAKPSLIVAIGIMIFQQLVGINAVIYFLPQVFIKGFHFPASNAIWVSVGIGIVNFIVTVLAYLIMDRVNRKTILIFGSVVMGVSLTLLCILNFTLKIDQAAIPTILLIAVYIFGFAISWGPIAWLLIGEIFPLKVRGVGTAIGSATNWFANFIVAQFFLTTLALFNNNVGGPFGIFAFFAFLSGLFVYFFVPETRNLSLEKIEENMRRKSS